MDHFRFLLDQETMWLRRVRWGGLEVIQAIYAAVRDQNWETVQPALKHLDIGYAADETRIKFSVECLGRNIRYQYEVSIVATAQALCYEFEGEARSDFLRNRIGLCVLHPLALCAGRACQVQHSDGHTEQGKFPLFVTPHQPFKDIRKLQHSVNETLDLIIEFEGETFEMEDQRNWTDSSFKTYGTPLSLPFPVEVRTGEKLKQTITAKLVERRANGLNSNHGQLTAEIEDESVISVQVDFRHLRPKTPIGFYASDMGSELKGLLVERMRAVQPSHLRVDWRFSENDGRERVERVAKEAFLTGAGLHIAAFLDAHPEEELRELSRIGSSLPAPIQLWLIFAEGEKCTPAALVRMAQKILRSRQPAASVAAGTNAYFAELNRKRPPSDAEWHPCFSVNPQVHASDDLSMIENLGAQADVVKTAALFSTRPVVISPITLKPRFNPNATSSVTSREIYDGRQNSLFAAAWTLGSVARLMRCESVHSLTYFEWFGPGGIMSERGDLYPVCHVFSALADLTLIAEIRCPETMQGIAAIAGMNKAGQRLMVLANLARNERIARLGFTPNANRIRVTRLDQEQVDAAASDPNWWNRTSVEISGNETINLPPLGIVRVELL